MKSTTSDNLTIKVNGAIRFQQNGPLVAYDEDLPNNVGTWANIFMEAIATCACHLEKLATFSVLS
jgi:hypothetical protein